MAHIDFKNRSITAKVVYYGCGLCGKTTNLEYVNSHSKDTSDLMAVSTEGDRTIFFDFLPMSLGRIRGIDTQFKLYAVPGQVRYNMTRKLVLKDVDGVVFVVDSQRAMLQANLDSLQNLYDNLAEQAIDPDGIPIVLQYNKRDLDEVMEVAELDERINKNNYPTLTGCAISGEGVFETLDQICRLVFDSLHGSMGKGAPEPPSKTAMTPVGENVGTSAEPGWNESRPPVGPADELNAPEEVEGEDEFETLASGVEVEQDPAAAPAVTHPVSPQTNQAPDVLPDLGSAPVLAAAAKMEALVAELRSYLTAAGLLPSASDEIGAAAPDLDSVTAPAADPAPAVAIAEIQASQREAEARAADAEGRAVELDEKLAAALAALAEATSRAPDQAAPPPFSNGAHALVSRALEERETELREARAAQRQAELRLIEVERELRHARKDLERERETKRSAGGGGDLEQELMTLRQQLESEQTSLDRAESARQEAEAASAAATAALQKAEARVRQLEEELNAAPTANATAPTVEKEKVDEPPVGSSSASLPSDADPAHVPSTFEGTPAPPIQAEPTASIPGTVPAAVPADDSLADDPEHKKTRRAARVMVSDLLLYHRDQVQEGLRNDNVYEILDEQIAEARKTYDSRVPEEIRNQCDYLALELEAMLQREAERLADDGTSSGEPPIQREEGDAGEPGPPTEPAPETSAPDSPSVDREVANERLREESTAETAPKDDPFVDHPEHRNAQRIARVMVGDLLLYHREEVLAGIQHEDLHVRLEEQIAEARKTFEMRVPEEIRRQRDHLGLELEAMIRRQTEGAGSKPGSSLEPPSEFETAPSNGGVGPGPVVETEPQETEPTADSTSEESREETAVAADSASVPDADELADHPEHRNARRIARVMVGDLFLYHRDQVLEGIRENNVYELLEEQIAEARKTYESRVSEEIRSQRDYLRIELERMIEERGKAANTR